MTYGFGPYFPQLRVLRGACGTNKAGAHIGLIASGDDAHNDDNNRHLPDAPPKPT